MMKKMMCVALCAAILLGLSLCGCSRSAKIETAVLNDSTVAIDVSNAARYLWLPVDDEAPLCSLRAETKEGLLPFAAVRPALKESGRYAAIALPAGIERLVLEGVSPKGFFMTGLSTSDERPPQYAGRHLPKCHYAPRAGWMGRVAAAAYVDSTYHLYYETNPHGIRPENIHWGHATSKDLIHWQEHDVVIGIDSIGECLGGCIVKDERNVFGAGKGALIAVYTATRGQGEGRRQEQCLAYSKDGGNTFVKFVTNPVLRTYDDDPDFRRPQVVRYWPKGWWSVVISCGRQLRIYTSDDLGNWNLESYMDDCAGTELLSYAVGNHPSKLDKKGLEIPVYEGAQIISAATSEDPMQWSLMVNASGTTQGNILKIYQGHFDGRTFQPLEGKCTLLDAGGSYSGAVALQGAGRRCFVLGRIGNDSTDSSGCMALPRELTFVPVNGRLLPQLLPAREAEALRRGCTGKPDIKAQGTALIADKLDSNGAAHEITMDIQATAATLELQTRTGETAAFHCPDGKSTLRIYVDSIAVEAFSSIPGATATMTIRSKTPVTTLSLKSGKAHIENLKIYRLGL